jgi:hypothetical protein
LFSFHLFNKMFSPKFAWKDYFTGSPATTLNSGQYTSNQTLSVSSVYVLSCLFNKCTIASGNGGALYCTSVTYFLVEFSSFFSCKTNSGEGGGIYFRNSNIGQSILYAVCVNDCCSTSIGLFARMYINNVESNWNYANYTSIARCVDDASKAYEALCLEFGRVYCSSGNISLNKCVQQFIVPLSKIQTMSLLHCCTPHLQTITLLSTIAFDLLQQVQILKLNVATSSGTHRLLLVQKEQFAQMGT